MLRREFIAGLGGLVATLLLPPLEVRAQQPIKSLMGFLHGGSPESVARSMTMFREILKNDGYIVGQNLTIEYRWAEGHFDRLPALATELVALKPDVIVSGNTAAALATRGATTTLPIVCVNCTDPVGMGLVTSEARPGTNVTGNLTRVEGLTGKQLELALEIMPGMTKIGVLTNVTNQSNLVQLREIEVAAAKLGLSLVPVEVRAPNDLHTAFQALARENLKMVLVLQDTMFLSQRKRIALLAAAARLATMFSFQEMVEDGGLMSYGIDPRENYRVTALYVDRILKGEKPAELPMQFPTKLALVINLTTARALGVTIPLTLLGRADEVIE